MALIVEDGSVVTGAESYVSVDDADTYHYVRLNTSWTALSTVQKEAHLRNATDYMTGQYESKWSGERVSNSQELDWPRALVYTRDAYIESTIVPKEIKNACALLALKSSEAELLPDETQVVIKEKVDVIETTFSEFSTQTKQYKEIDSMLSRYLSRTGGNLQMIRTA